MIRFKLLLATTLFLSYICCTCGYRYFYWREYTGTIPSDAIVAGRDISGKDLYIGQAYVKNGGWQVVPIYQGIKEAIAVLNGPKKTDKYIKVSTVR